MPFRIAINGYGRIGRCVLRALYESGRRADMAVVGINDLSNMDSIAHLTRFDSTHGRFAGRVVHEGATLYVNDDPIEVSFEKNPAALPWAKLGVDAVLECTGSFIDRATAEGHLKSGAKKVVFPARRKTRTPLSFTVSTIPPLKRTILSFPTPRAPPIALFR